MKILSFAWTVLLTCVLAAAPVSTSQPQDILRLKPGNYWVYQGQAEWVDASGPDGIGKSHLTWKMEVLEEVDHGDVKAFLIKGSVLDLPWYQPGLEPGLSVWLFYQSRLFATDEFDLARFRDPKDPLTDVLKAQKQEDPILDFPLQTKRCARALYAQPVRADHMYCWYAEMSREKGVKVGDNSFSNVDVWTAAFRTNPDHQILTFADGIGITGYDYSHHGTTSEVHLKLAEVKLN